MRWTHDRTSAATRAGKHVSAPTRSAEDAELFCVSVAPVAWPSCADDVVVVLPFAALPEVLPEDVPEDVPEEVPPVEPAPDALDVLDGPADDEDDELLEPAPLFSRTATEPGVTSPV